MAIPFRRPPKKELEHRINHMITSPMVRVVGDGGINSIYTIAEARRLAQEMGVDLVEIAPHASPPVCKLIDYNKFLYDKKKKEKEIKARQVKQVTKEIRFTPNTDDHDFDFKTRHAENFLKEGAKVKAYVQFRGRMIVFKDRGELLLLRLIDRLKDVGTVENLPKMEGNRMWVVINPKPKHH